MRSQLCTVLLVTLSFFAATPAQALVAKTKSKVAAAVALTEQERELLKTLQTPNRSADELLEASKKLYRLRAGRELCTFAGDDPIAKSRCENRLLEIYGQDTAEGRSLTSLCELSAGKEARIECLSKYDEIHLDLRTMNDEPDGISADLRKMDRTPEQLKSFVSVNLAMKLKQMSEKFVHTSGSSSGSTNSDGQH